ncbi:MAG: hypothetical protein CMB45_06340 [Euryarchaeota archaeon]|nr:hypothetical protein [Euryarchaeota archaeon]|tara:strand:+ start:632 stop:2191 length:1560 start_codon:yes stop_codon:yes gene_type:complete
MQIRSLQDAHTLRQTIIKVDKEISRRRRAIRRNLVPNAGIARDQVEAMVRANNHRKAVLRMNQNEIRVMRRKERRFTPLRNSFITPDGPRDKGNKSKPFVRISEEPRGQNIIRAPITKKQGKKMQGQRIPVVDPAPTIAKGQSITQAPVQQNNTLSKVADAVRQERHVLAKQASDAVKKANDAARDAELLAQKREAEVIARRQSEIAAQKKKEEESQKRAKAAELNRIKERAMNAEKNVRQFAQKKSTSLIRAAKGRFQPMQRRGSFRGRGSGIVPQLAVMTALSDKGRAAKVNQATRSPSKAPQGPIKDQITEDIRQHKPVKPTHSPEYYELMKEINQMAEYGRGVVQQVVKTGKFEYMDFSKMGQNRIDYYGNKAYSVIAQLQKMALNELVRWDQGALSAGVAVSTNNRSQSKRKMSVTEFKQYVEKKARPIVEPLMNEFMQEMERFENAARIAQQQKSLPTNARNISIDTARQATLRGIDNLRGHGRPVLSEQQGTKGLAGLFPALRSSMQGVLKQ